MMPSRIRAFARAKGQLAKSDLIGADKTHRLWRSHKARAQRAENRRPEQPRRTHHPPRPARRRAHRRRKPSRPLHGYLPFFFFSNSACCSGVSVRLELGEGAVGR